MRLNSRLSSDLDSLAFADFNGDRRTDVARSRGGAWEVSSGGTSGWRKLREGGMPPLSLMLFGDFTGDGRADVLQRAKLEQARPPATGLVPVSLDRYTLSSGGAKPLQPWSVPNLR